MDEEGLMKILRQVDTIPRAGKSGTRRRTVYETSGLGRFYMDYAAYGGSMEEVPKELILRLESEGKLVRAFPTAPTVNCWALPDEEGVRGL